MVWYGNLADGIRISSAFGHTDSRDRMRAWLKRCAPADARVGFEPYTGTVAADGIVKPIETPKAERLRPEAYARLGLHYQVTSPSMPGRGLRHPWTQQRYARIESNYNAFTNRMTPLRHWTLSAGIRPVFSQIDLELRGWMPADVSTRIDVPVVLTRPVLVDDGQTRFYAPQSEAAIGLWAGVRVVGRRHQVAVSPEQGRPLFMIALQAGGPHPAVLRWSGLFNPREAPVDPVAVFTLGAEVWPATQWNMFPTAKVRLRREEPFVRCAVMGTASAAEAAHALRVGGGPEQALAFLDARAACEPLAMAARVERFLAADACARRRAVRDPARQAPPPPGAEDAAAARLACEALDMALAAAPDQAEAIFVNGASLAHLADFSRIRFRAESMIPCSADARLPARPGEVFRTELPCILLPGAYEATFIFSCGSICYADCRDDCRVMHPLPKLTLAACTVESVDATCIWQSLQLRYQIRFRADASGMPVLLLETADNAKLADVSVVSAELTWAPLEQLRARRDELAAALDRPAGAAAPE